jgi:tetratricopeptide (TPR) repeat protein
MQLEVSRIEKLFLPARLLPILILDFFVSVTCITFAPGAMAQASSFERADGEISGTVLLEPGKRPASQVAVSLKSRVGGIFRSVLTDFEGRFKVQNLPRGTYEIVVEEDGYESAQTSAQIESSSADLVVHLSSKSGPISRSDYLVSVRELKIPWKARNEFQKGLDLVAQNDAAGSLSHFAKATQAFPAYFEAYYNLGAAEVALGRNNEAMKAFQTSVDSSGGRYALAEFGIGYLLCREGKPTEAEKIIRRGLEVDDAAPEGYVILGQALKQLNRLDEAESSEHEALLRNPNLPGAYLVLSDVAQSRGDYRAEIRNLDVYLKLQPNGPGSALARRVREGAQNALANAHPPN